MYLLIKVNTYYQNLVAKRRKITISKVNKESHGLQAWTVLFEVSCKLISRKSLSLIKIENCLGVVCLIKCS